MINLSRLVLIILIMGFMNPVAKAQKKKSEAVDHLFTITTHFGDIKILLYDDTPVHKENFIKLVSEGFYNHTGFHRIINGFMIQGGQDTTSFSQGKNLEEITLPAEFQSRRTHVRGAVSMARTENPEKRSDRTQFFIVQNANGAHFLDNQYTVFGQVMSGIDVVDRIAALETDTGDRPVYPVRMQIRVETVKRSDILKFYSWVYE